MNKFKYLNGAEMEVMYGKQFHARYRCRLLLGTYKGGDKEFGF
jgi:hypothetical protein